MSTYSEVVSRILGLNGMRDYLARVISGKNPDGTNFSINSGATGSVLPSASGKSSGEVLTLTQDGRSDTADWREPTAQSGSGLPSNVRTVTTTATAVDGDFIIADATSAGFTVTLPATGTVIIKKVDGSGNAVAITPAGGGTVDGDTGGATITSPQFGAMLKSTASNTWKIVSPTAAGGSSGTNGLSILHGSGAPSSGTGSDGEFYVDTTAHAIYGPKTSGAWGSSTSLIGPQGTNGTNGTNGILATFKDEGAAVTARDTIDVQGNGAALSQDGTKLILAIPGGDPRALTGATAATRFVGGTTTGAPSTGTFAVGDFVIARDGAIWICTSLGTPGTWTQVSGGGGASGDFRAEYVELHGLLGANYDPMHWGSSEVVPDGYELYFRVMLRKAQQIANLHVHCYSDGASNTYGRMGVYSSTGTLLGRTATLANMTAGFKTLALTAESGQLLPTGGPGVWIRVGMLWTGGTAPNLAKNANASLIEAVNVNLSGTSARFSAGAGGSAALPTTDPGGSTTSRAYWIGVS